MKKNCFYFCFLLTNTVCLSQQIKHSDIIKRPDIQYISLTNRAISSTIKNFIKIQNDTNKLFKQGFGYISVSDIKINFKSFALQDINNAKKIVDYQKDTVLSFSLFLSSAILLDDGFEFFYNKYPPFYTFLEGRLILLYDDIPSIYSVPIQCGQFCNKSPYSYKSKKKLQKLVMNTLNLVRDTNFVFTGIENRKYILTKDQRKKMELKDIYMNSILTFNTYKVYYCLRDDTIIY